MKKLLLILLIITLSSCEALEGEQNYNKKVWEIKTKNLELDYLERLYSLKESVTKDQKIKTIDSLINQTK